MNNHRRNILITGGCGFIGSNFIKKIINYNFNLIIVDNLSTGFYDNIKKILISKKKNKRIKFIKVNLNNLNKVTKIFKENTIDYIFHFAAFSSVEMSLKNPKKILHNNLKSTENLVNLTKKFKVKYFIFSSSASVYGNLKFKKNINENYKTKPINPYGVSKLRCENLIKKDAVKLGYKFCIFRYFNVVGKHPSKKIIKKKNLNLFKKIDNCIKFNKILEIHGNKLDTSDGTPVRDFIHIDDVVTAHVECLKQNHPNFWNNIYNIGYNKGVSVLQIVKECKKIFNLKLRFKYVKKNKGIISRSISSNAKFIGKSNWKPGYSKLDKMVKSYFLR